MPSFLVLSVLSQLTIVLHLFDVAGVHLLPVFVDDLLLEELKSGDVSCGRSAKKPDAGPVKV